MYTTIQREVWSSAFDLLIENGEFTISDLNGFDNSEKYTVNRVLKHLEELGWLERDSPNGTVWYAGPNVKTVIDRGNRPR